MSRRAQRAMRESGALVRVHNGWYTDAENWAAAYSEGRQLGRIAAATASMRTDGCVFSHASAAALWGLPLYRLEPDRVHVTLRPSAAASSTRGVFRHRDALLERDVIEVQGVPCTSLERTVVDIARSARSETALAAADAALRLVAWSDASRRYDEDAAQAFRAGAERRIGAMKGRRGVRQARWILEHADGRAQLPGESVSRHHLLHLGFTALRLQVPVRGPTGADYFVDFGLDDCHAWGEFDGIGKYTDAAIVAGRSPDELLLAEKAREDWIRAATGRTVARWGFAHLTSPATLAQRLAAYGIRPPRR